MSDDSSQQGTPEKEEEDDEEFEQQKLFSENEICSIEEKQELNIFEDVKEYMEDNYIELETMISKLKVDQREDENDLKVKQGYQCNFNKEGLYNMINVHEHLN